MKRATPSPQQIAATLADQAAARLLARLEDFEAFEEWGAENRSDLYDAVVKETPADQIDPILERVQQRAKGTSLEDEFDQLRRIVIDLADQHAQFGYLLSLAVGRRLGQVKDGGR